MKTFRGILPAIVTPFDADGQFHAPTFERLLERFYAAGVHGVYVCGTTGEGVLQAAEARKRVAEVAVEASPSDKAVVVHVGAASTREAAELARHASRIGADAVSSLPPPSQYRFGEVKGYYRDLAAASDVPLLVYYFPALSPSFTGLDPILELCALDGVAGLKFTDFDLYTLSVLRERGIPVFNGRDEVLVAGMLMGANGGIGTFYNIAPERFVRLFELAQVGRWDEARAVQSEINRLIRVVLRYPLFPAIKQILAWSGLDVGPCLLPRQPLSEEEAAGLKSDLEREGLLELVLGKAVMGH